jgi:hypothetical protein
MRPVYQECAEDRGPGVTERSMTSIHSVLSDTGKRSPLALFARDTCMWLRSTDRRQIANNLHQSVSPIVDQLYEAVDEMLSKKMEDEAGLAARADLKQFVSTLLADLEQIGKDLQVVKAKYEPPQLLVKLQMRRIDVASGVLLQV